MIKFLACSLFCICAMAGRTQTIYLHCGILIEGSDIVQQQMTVVIEG